MSQEKLQTMIMQNFWGVKEVHYGIVQVVNSQLEGYRKWSAIKVYMTQNFLLAYLKELSK